MPKHKKRYVYPREYHLGDPAPEPKGEVFASAADKRRTNGRSMKYRPSQGNTEQAPNEHQTPFYAYGNTLDLDNPDAGMRITDGSSKRAKPTGGRTRRAPDSDGLTGMETGHWADRILEGQEGNDREGELSFSFRR